jgi:hypothetical protein
MYLSTLADRIRDSERRNGERGKLVAALRTQMEAEEALRADIRADIRAEIERVIRETP